jgi:hypothetical protein
LQAVKEADAAALASVVSRSQVSAILRHFQREESAVDASQTSGAQ